MSHLSPDEQARLDELAYWIRELFSERGHRIGAALEHDPSFSDGELGRSALARMMMRTAVAAASGRTGMNVIPGDGGARTVQSFDGRYDRRYRVLSANKQPDGSYRILSSSDKILEVDPDSMFVEEPWVLGYTLNLDNQVEDLFVAQVLDRTEGDPGQLVLGPVHTLLGRQPPTDGDFRTTDEGLPGFEDEDDEGASGIG
jgi:hypothetical protein